MIAPVQNQGSFSVIRRQYKGIYNTRASKACQHCSSQHDINCSQEHLSKELSLVETRPVTPEHNCPFNNTGNSLQRETVIGQV